MIVAIPGLFSYFFFIHKVNRTNLEVHKVPRETNRNLLIDRNSMYNKVQSQKPLYVTDEETLINFRNVLQLVNYVTFVKSQTSLQLCVEKRTDRYMK